MLGTRRRASPAARWRCRTAPLSKGSPTGPSKSPSLQPLLSLRPLQRSEFCLANRVQPAVLYTKQLQQRVTTVSDCGNMSWRDVYARSHSKQTASDSESLTRLGCSYSLANHTIKIVGRQCACFASDLSKTFCDIGAKVQERGDAVPILTTTHSTRCTQCMQYTMRTGKDASCVFTACYA